MTSFLLSFTNVISSSKKLSLEEENGYDNMNSSRKCPKCLSMWVEMENMSPRNYYVDPEDSIYEICKNCREQERMIFDSKERDTDQDFSFSQQFSQTSSMREVVVLLRSIANSLDTLANKP